LLAKSALDGLARRCEGEDTKGNPQRPAWHTGQNQGISLMRYADELVVVAPARPGLAHDVLPTLARFLAASGLRLREANTRMGPSPEGCHCLGCESRRLPRALLTPPQQAKMRGHYRTLTTYRHQQKQSPAVQGMHDLNPIMRGWGNAYRHGAATRACRKLDHVVGPALWRWAKRRHPTQAAPWVSQRYCRTVGHRQGVLAAAQAQILWYQDIPVTRAPKGRGKSSPMNPALQGYGAQREQGRQKTLTSKPQRKNRLPAQDVRCGLCKVPCDNGDPIDDHHIPPQHKGGDDRQENHMRGHRWGHHAHHQRHG
jgi:RNA-directed DNA polymerase